MPYSSNPLSSHPLAGSEEPQIERGDEMDPDQLGDEDQPDMPIDDPDIPKSLVELPAWKRFLFSKWGCAVLLTLLTVIILLIIRPAFFLKRRENTLERPRTNWVVVFITTLVLFAAYAGIPALVVYCRKKWVGQKAS